MNWVGRRKLLHAIDHERIEEAIRAAERKTSGEIRVSIAPFFWGNVERAADHAFDKLKMRKTEQRNGVLFFVVPARKRFVVLGDEGIHARVGQAFWEKIASAMGADFHEGRFTDGLLRGIDAVGEELSAHFPSNPRDIDELPNEVHVGRL